MRFSLEVNAREKAAILFRDAVPPTLIVVVIFLKASALLAPFGVLRLVLTPPTISLQLPPLTVTVELRGV